MKNKEDKFEHINLVLRTIRNVNQLLIKEKDRDKLLQGICDNFIKNRGYYNTWIALLDESNNLITYAEAGLGEEFSPMIERLKSGKLTYCGRNALLRPDAIVIEDPVLTCEDCPLSSSYGGRGAMVTRLENESKVYGLLSASIPKSRSVDEDEQRLFKEVAGDIAFALYNIDREKEHQRNDEALRESEQRFRNLVENSIMGISIFQDNEIVYQNPEMDGIISPLPRKYLLTDLERIYHEDVEKVKKFYNKITSGEVQTLDTDFRFYSKSRAASKLALKWVYCRAIIVEYKGKEAILVNMMDITRIKEMEHQLRIQDKMTSLGRVAAGIAHEIRNPLSGINIYIDALEKIYEREQDKRKVKQILEQIHTASNKIESIIKRVMDFSKPSEPTFVSTDINQPIEEAINLSSVTLRKIGIKVEKVLANGLPACKVDPQLIEHVILNLITNAAEAMKSMDGTKKINITSSKERNRIFVRVSDSGPGVSSDLKEKIFDPFYSTKNGSTGIGLSMSQRIIKDHGGSLTVAGSKLGGAEFLIEIPIKKGKIQR